MGFRSWRPLFGDDGEFRGYIGSCVDVTDRVVAQKAIEESEQRWRQVFENTQVGVAVQDASLNFIEANEAYQKMTGYGMDALRSMTCMELTHQEDRPHYQFLIDEMLSGQRDHLDVEKRDVRKNGETIWVHIFGSSFGSGEDRLWVTVVRDISERKRTGEALRASERQQTEIAKQLEIESARLVEAQASKGWQLGSRAADSSDNLVGADAPHL